MTENGQQGLEETMKELEAGISGSEADMSVPDGVALNIRVALRKQLVVDYQRLILSARLNDKVENKDLASQQREAAKKVVIQVHELDLEIGQLQYAGVAAPDVW